MKMLVGIDSCVQYLIIFLFHSRSAQFTFLSATKTMCSFSLNTGGSTQDSFCFLITFLHYLFVHRRRGSNGPSIDRFSRQTQRRDPGLNRTEFVCLSVRSSVTATRVQQWTSERWTLRNFYFRFWYFLRKYFLRSPLIYHNRFIFFCLLNQFERGSPQLCPRVHIIFRLATP